MRDRRWDFLYDRQKQPVKGWILDGFTRFAGVQGEFMAGLGEA